MDNTTTLFIGAALGLVIGLSFSLRRRPENKSLHLILNKLNQIIMTQAEATQQINDLTTQVGKIRGEIQKLIDAAGNQPNITPELEAAIVSAKAAIQGIDEMNPDEETPPV